MFCRVRFAVVKPVAVGATWYVAWINPYMPFPGAAGACAKPLNVVNNSITVSNTFKILFINIPLFLFNNKYQTGKINYLLSNIDKIRFFAFSPKS
jgi:hypothetical protein